MIVETQMQHMYIYVYVIFSKRNEVTQIVMR